jgi:hypothetical protein
VVSAIAVKPIQMILVMSENKSNEYYIPQPLDKKLADKDKMAKRKSLSIGMLLLHVFGSIILVAIFMIIFGESFEPVKGFYGPIFTAVFAIIVGYIYKKLTTPNFKAKIASENIVCPTCEKSVNKGELYYVEDRFINWIYNIKRILCADCYQKTRLKKTQ